jgi:hypothetical protein
VLVLICRYSPCIDLLRKREKLKKVLDEHKTDDSVATNRDRIRLCFFLLYIIFIKFFGVLHVLQNL